jgi:hypothetical protein
MRWLLFAMERTTGQARPSDVFTLSSVVLGNPNGVAIIQPRVGPATAGPTLGRFQNDQP